MNVFRFPPMYADSRSYSGIVNTNSSVVNLTAFDISGITKSLTLYADNEESPKIADDAQYTFHQILQMCSQLIGLTADINVGATIQDTTDVGQKKYSFSKFRGRGLSDILESFASATFSSWYLTGWNTGPSIGHTGNLTPAEIDSFTPRSNEIASGYLQAVSYFGANWNGIDVAVNTNHSVPEDGFTSFSDNQIYRDSIVAISLRNTDTGHKAHGGTSAYGDGIRIKQSSEYWTDSYINSAVANANFLNKYWYAFDLKGIKEQYLNFLAGQPNAFIQGFVNLPRKSPNTGYLNQFQCNFVNLTLYCERAVTADLSTQDWTGAEWDYLSEYFANKNDWRYQQKIVKVDEKTPNGDKYYDNYEHTFDNKNKVTT
jgi:hypothetical protein